MYNILPDSTDQILVIRVEGYTNSQDLNTMLPHLKTRLQFQKIRILLILDNTTGIDLYCVLKLIPFFLQYGKHIEKKAILTDEIWIHRWVKRFAPFDRSKVRCFLNTHIEQAWEWVKK